MRADVRERLVAHLDRVRYFAFDTKPVLELCIYTAKDNNMCLKPRIDHLKRYAAGFDYRPSLYLPGALSANVLKRLFGRGMVLGFAWDIHHFKTLSW